MNEQATGRQLVKEWAHRIGGYAAAARAIGCGRVAFSLYLSRPEQLMRRDSMVALSRVSGIPFEVLYRKNESANAVIAEIRDRLRDAGRIYGVRAAA